MKKIFLLTSLLGVVSLGSMSHCLAQTKPTTNIAANKRWEAFSDEIDALRKRKFIPGIAFAVIKDGQTFGSNGLGFADSNREIPVTPDTPFWIASVTKTFVGLAYLHLEHEAKVDLEELAAETPDFTDLCQWLASTTIPFSDGLECDAPIKIRHILNHQVNNPPGTEFMYNPIMYSRLSRHLEYRLGEGWNRVEGRHNFLGQTIDRTILEPANMTRTMSSMWDRSKALVYYDMADGFAVDEEGYKTKLRRPDKHIAGGAGVVSTVSDMAKYEIALSSGAIANQTIKAKLETAANFNDGTAAPYGYGWYFQCYRGEKLMWHGGWDPDAGYSALHLRLPERNLAFTVLSNGEGVWWENPLREAKVENSDFAQTFFKYFLFENELPSTSTPCAN